MFHPKFDGQLYYGFEADNRGFVKTTLPQIKRRKLSSGEAHFKDKNTIEERSTVLINNKPIISRTIPIAEDFSVTVWEIEKPSAMIEKWIMHGSSGSIHEEEKDPFGVVMWPGSIVAAQEMFNRRLTIQNATVLVLGAGLGVEVQTAVRIGARKVIATDINPFTLQLLQYGLERSNENNNSSTVVETLLLDICSDDEDEILKIIAVEEVDVVIVADVLYNERLAKCVGKHCWDILNTVARPILLIVTDSQRFHGTDFLKVLNSKNEGVKTQNLLQWKEVLLKNITGSGVLIDEDQTYDIKARMLCISNREWPSSQVE